MTRGRPPNWNPFAQAAPDAWTEALLLTSKNRLSVPAAVWRRIEWLPAVREGGLLAKLSPNGSAELLPWVTSGRQLVEEEVQRLQHMPEAKRAEVAVALMDCFMRIGVEQHRLSLPPNLISFLGAEEEELWIRVVTSRDRIWLWNEGIWQARRVERLALLGQPA